MSFEAERVQTPRSLESLRFLHRTDKLCILLTFAWICTGLCNNHSTGQNRKTHIYKQILILIQTIQPLQICSVETKRIYCRKYCNTEIKLWPFSMSLYSWSIKESKCSLCWAGSSSASQAWTHWLRELRLDNTENKDREVLEPNWAPALSWLKAAVIFTWCQCLVHWSPPKQTENGNPPGQTTAIQSHL